jgi:PhnB protein
MTLTIAPHLNLPGTARAALGFYQIVFGGHVHVMTYAEFGVPQDAPDAGKVVFGQLQTDQGVRVLAYDIPGRTDTLPGSTARTQGLTTTDQPFFLSVEGDTLEETTRYWDGLSEGATIVEPLTTSAWSAGFGMLTDQFGVTWIIGVRSNGAA